ncbi:metallophosphoesterase [Leptospira sp. 96542]|nr:metallophosphoesterase [Leptospira sp. 96542]
MKFALIGDIHAYWDKEDIDYFNSSDYDFLFFTGDINGTPLQKKVSFEGLTKRAYLIPGNWDSTSLIGIIGEVIQSKNLIRLGQIGQNRRSKIFVNQIQPLSVMGYSTITVSKELDLSLLVGRPYAMGGGLSFAPNLRKNYFVSTMEESIEKYKSLIQGVKEKNIFILSHNGPFGLGAEPKSMYGADFKKSGGDWGDLDLQEAIKFAKQIGKKVPVVMSGHMHHKVSKKKERETLQYTGGTFYINGAKVPRIQEGKRFHTKIEWNGGSATVIPIWV